MSNPITLSRRGMMAGMAGAGLVGLSGLPLAAQGTPVRGGVLVLGIGGGSTTDDVDVRKLQDWVPVNQAYMLMNGLIEIDAKNEAIPELFESWETSQGATEWLFKVRQGVTFHDGKTLTADDVVYSLDLHRGDTKSAARSIAEAFTSVEKVSDSEVRITLADGKTIDLKLPKGVEDGTQMRLTGKGEQGPGGAGDALVTIQIASHPFFTRQGDDLRLDLPVTLDEALNGAKVKVPTAEGAVMLSVPAGSSSGKVLRLKGKGFTRKDGTRGDQLVTVEIMLPEQDDDLASRLEGWKDQRAVRAKLGV